jgi:triphosphoribosyl-dephospho-CoA synthase
MKPRVNSGAVAEAFLSACELDVASLKPGNVRRGHPAHGMSAEQFIDSAQACASDLCDAGASIGARVLNAICSTRKVVRCNTNLGIVLLAAPLCRAAQSTGDLRTSVEVQLQRLDRDDAVRVYRAIRLAQPGGLGDAPEHDVRREPAVTLLEAMRAAGGRDSIARQYASGFRDVFEVGVPEWRQALDRFGDPCWAATAVYLAFLSRWPDTLIKRKFGVATAQAVSDRAAQLYFQMSSGLQADEMVPGLLNWDRELRAAGMNPGTSADLTVASALAAKLMQAV